jgi:hypothetical protein
MKLLKIHKNLLNIKCKVAAQGPVLHKILGVSGIYALA